ncbi:hypothetical protein, partial [Clostridium botulinum]
NVSSAYAAESCHVCGARIARGENHACCDYLGHDWLIHSKVSLKDGLTVWNECTRCHARI